MKLEWLKVVLVIAITNAVFAQDARQTLRNTSTSAAPEADSKPESRSELEARVRAEWDAFKNKDVKTCATLLADDFVGIEDDGEGTRSKRSATNEVSHSVLNNYSMAFFKVLPLGTDVALATYEITMQFQPSAQVRIKRVYISEVWVKRNGQWLARHYQETRVR